jgi:ankyrin repeat protein
MVTIISLLCGISLWAAASLEPTTVNESSLSIKAQTSSACETMLIKAIRDRQAGRALDLIHEGADLNATSCSDGNTALLEALGSDSSIAMQLIMAGANPNQADAQKNTPLMSAAHYCLLDVASLLIKKGAAVNAKNSDGSTALMSASARCSDGKLIAILLHSGADIDTKRDSGGTALTTAAFYGNEAGVIALVAAGADVHSETKQGEDALSIADSREVGRTAAHDRISQFLRLVVR